MKRYTIGSVTGLCQSTTPPGQSADMSNVIDPIQIFYQTLNGSGE